jgi:hypothetical protein
MSRKSKDMQPGHIFVGDPFYKMRAFFSLQVATNSAQGVSDSRLKILEFPS